MYLECQLVFKSYKPLNLEKGMLFLTNIKGEHAIRELNEVPRDQEEFITINGYPVEPYIVDIGNVHLNEERIVATPDQIGWFDEGEHSDELSDISITNMNDILEHFDGWIDLEMVETEDGEDYVPILYNNKVTIRLPDDYDDDEWDDDIDDEEYEEEDNKDDYNAIY